MEHIQQSIINYIQSNSQYALLVDGKWGVGKTFFITEKIIPDLELDNQYELIYISLNGYDSLNSIRKKIENEILGIEEILSSSIEKSKDFNNEWINSIGNAADFFLSRRNNKKILQYTNKIVLFIDDLERLSSKVSLNDCLGLISTEFMEKLKCKVVFIANSEEINKKKNSDFPRIKEKVIDKTLLFNPPSKLIVSEILSTSDSAFITNNLTFLLDIISYFYETINIRSLKSIIMNFSFFDIFIDKCDIEKEYLSSLKKSVFLNIMVLTQEYKQGNIDTESLNDFEFNSKFISSRYGERFIDLFTLSKEDQADEEHKEREKKSKVGVITKKYHGVNRNFDENIFYFKGIESYIFHGYYDKELFDESYKKWKNFYFPSKNFFQYEKLNNFRDMQDSELFERQNKVVSNMKDEIYTLIDIIKIYKLFLEFKRMDLLLIQEDCLKKIECEIYERYIEENDTDIQLYFQIIKEYNFNEISSLESNIKRIKKELDLINLKNFLKAIFENNDSVLGDTIDRAGLDQLFSIMDDEIINEYILINNSSAHNFMFFLKGHFFNKKLITKDVNRIVKYLKASDKNKFGKIDNFKILQLISELEKLIS